MCLQVKKEHEMAYFGTKIPFHPPLEKGEVKLRLLVPSFFKRGSGRIFKKHGPFPAEGL